MKSAQPPIIALHPAGRGFGYVVMSGPFSLVDWGVFGADKHKNAACLARITRLLDRFDPQTLVLEDPTRGPKRSERIHNLCKAIAALCHSRRIDLATFSRAELFRCYSVVGATTWQDIAEAVARQLEMLRKLVPSRRRAWETESRRMSIFVAAALAMTYWQLSGTDGADLAAAGSDG